MPPPTTSQNIATTTHHQPKYIHHHLPPPTTSLNNPPPPSTSQNISTTIHNHPLTAKTFFIRNPFIRISSHCLTATWETWTTDLQLLRNFFFTWPTPLFLLYTPEMVLKSCSVNEPSYYAKLVLKKDKFLSVENILVLKFDKAILKK